MRQCAVAKGRCLRQKWIACLVCHSNTCDCKSIELLLGHLYYCKCIEMRGTVFSVKSSQIRKCKNGFYKKKGCQRLQMRRNVKSDVPSFVNAWLEKLPARMIVICMRRKHFESVASESTTFFIVSVAPVECSRVLQLAPASSCFCQKDCQENAPRAFPSLSFFFQHPWW